MLDIRDNDRLTLVLHDLGSRRAVSESAIISPLGHFGVGVDASPLDGLAKLAVVCSPIADRVDIDVEGVSHLCFVETE